MECAAALDVLVTVGACARDPVDESKQILLGIVSMLTRMTEDSGSEVREEEAEYQ